MKTNKINKRKITFDAFMETIADNGKYIKGINGDDSGNMDGIVVKESYSAICYIDNVPAYILTHYDATQCIIQLMHRTTRNEIWQDKIANSLDKRLNKDCRNWDVMKLYGHMISLWSDKHLITFDNENN